MANNEGTMQFINMRIIILFLSFFICSGLTANPKQNTSDKDLQLNNIEVRLSALSEKIEVVESTSNDRYNRLSDEFDRDFSWLAIVIAVIGIVLGVILPIVINNEYKKIFERDIKRNEETYNEKVKDIESKISEFTKDYRDFKANYKISSLLDHAVDNEDLDIKIKLYSEVLNINPNHEIALLRSESLQYAA